EKQILPRSSLVGERRSGPQARGGARSADGDRLGRRDACDLVGVHRAAAADRHIFARHEAFLAEPETDLVVALAFLVVEIPLPARLAPQPADAVVLARPEPPDAADGLVRLPFGRVEASLGVERHQQVVALVAIAFGMAL